jgi:hypothetical protein
LKEPKQELIEIAKPILIVASVLTVLAVVFLAGLGRVEGLWLVFPLSGIRISTAITAIACFAIVLFLQRKNTLKSIYYSLLAVVFPLASFELVWYYSAAVLRGWDLKIMEFGALFGWVLLGISAVFRTRPSKVAVILYGAFAISFAVWFGSGFTFNDLSNPSFSVSAEVLNVFSKGALFFAYAVHVGSVGLGCRSSKNPRKSSTENWDYCLDGDHSLFAD